MKKYMTPDFDVTVYEIEDVITVNVGPGDPDGMGGTSWNLDPDDSEI
jgi:hypothetical protein